MTFINNSTKIIAALIMTGATLTQSLPVYACAFSIDPYFTYTNHPDFPLKKFAAGNLSVLQRGYARSYLLTAYRYLSGSPLSTDEQNAMVALWDKRLLSNEYGCAADTSSWLKARKLIPGAPKLDAIDTEKSISQEEDWQTYCNCQTSAFDTAAKTLNSLVAKYGASSSDVSDWLKAQDEVFSDCGNPPYDNKTKAAAIPVPLPDSASVSLRQQRDYQIAAANFYSQKWDAAQTQFEKIATDKTSPWHQLAAYLAVRTKIRKATLSKQVDVALLAAARDDIKRLSAVSDMSSFSDDFAELSSYIAVRLDPNQHLQNLAKLKFSTNTTGELTKTIDNIVGDTSESGDTLVYDKFPQSVKSPDMIDWVMTLQAGDETAKKHALAKWNETRATQWLVAAVVLAGSRDAGLAALITAAKKVQSVPARSTLAYHLIRLNLDNHKNDVARTSLDKIIAESTPQLSPELSLSGLNAFKTQRLTVSTNLNDFVKFGLQNPVCICSSGGVDQVPDDIENLEKGKKAAIEPVVFTPEAGYVMDNKLPLSLLKALAQNTQIPTNLRAHIAWTSWVRAILLDDETNGRALATIMRPFNKSKQKLVDAYLSASTPADRKFAANFMMLQYSSAQPMVGFGPLQPDSYGDESGWWWGTMTLPVESSNRTDGDMTQIPLVKFNPLFLSAAEKSAAKLERVKLATIQQAPNYFAKNILAYAQSHPSDSRVPEALHLLVKATRYGSTDDATKAFSKQAYNVLHTKYKSNPWTLKTKYYY